MLPSNDKPWPLAQVAPWYAQAEVSSAWYEGNLDALTRIYGPAGADREVGASWRNGSLMSGGLVGGAKAIARRWFNGQPLADSFEVTRLHSPLAGNLAALSSALLFAEPPTIRLIDLEADGGRKAGKILDEKAQDRLDAITGSDMAHIAMSRAGEYAAGIGAAAFTLAWDRAEDEPWIQAHAGDAAIPEFVNGRLRSLLTFDVYEGTNGKVWRHLISHDRGTVTHGLYLGTVDKLGEIIPIGDRRMPEELAYLVTMVTTPKSGALRGTAGEVIVPTGITSLTASYMPNATSRKGRHDPLLSQMGRSDYEGIEEFLDAHDETWSSAIRDLKLGRGRLLVPDAFLEGKGRGNGAYFDAYAEIMTGIATAGAGGDDLGKSIEKVQFEIRWEAHIKMLYAEVAEVLQHAGYSRSSYGDDAMVEQTAQGDTTEAKRSERTRDLKARYARMALGSISLAGLEMDQQLYNRFTLPKLIASNIDVRFPDVSQIDTEKQARTISFLRAADAISIWQAVRERNPNWDETEVDKEVDRITEERASAADPFGEGAATPDARDQANGQDGDEQPRTGNEGGANDGGNRDQASQVEPPRA